MQILLGKKVPSATLVPSLAVAHRRNQSQNTITDNGIAWITPKDLSVDKSKFISHGADDINELGLKKKVVLP